MLVPQVPLPVVVVLDVVAWGVFHATTGYLAHRLGPDRLARDGWVLRTWGGGAESVALAGPGGDAAVVAAH